MALIPLRLAFVAMLAGAASAAINDEQWGYVDVRPGAHAFWWLYGSTGKPRETAPIVLWLQGGPGASGSGYGNFEELGPLTSDLLPRNTTWALAANLLFVDSPVGAGFSYVDDESLLVRTDEQVGLDLVAVFRNLTAIIPEMATLPFYVFCESYGGKETVSFATALLAAMDAGFNINFKGIAIGDSWISPIDFVDTWAPLLRSLSVLDEHQKTTIIDPDVQSCDAAVAAGQWDAATNAWGRVESDVSRTTDDIDFYNVLLHHAPNAVSKRRQRGAPLSAVPSAPHSMSAAAARLASPGIDATILADLYDQHVARLGADLDALMNGPIKQKLGIIPASVTWGGQSDAVFSAMSTAFMQSYVPQVDALLTGGRISVTIYEGQLDLICATVGAERWMQRLNFTGMPAFYSSTKTALYPPGTTSATGAFVKTSGRLSYYTVMNAGHMVPADNGPMALAMVNRILAAA